MRGLFWKFFIIIWLTMTASIAGLFVVGKLLDAAPFSQEILRQKRVMALDVAARLLEQKGIEAAKAYAHAAATVPQPVHLSISEVDTAANCTNGDVENVRNVISDNICTRVVLVTPKPGAMAGTWPKLLPWASALIASAVAAFALARYLIGPVAHLRHGLSALAHGRFDVRIGDRMHGRKDEVAALAHDFDTSAARLQDLQEIQQRLFHDVSHELRSPLSRLQAALGVLRQNPSRLDKMIDRMDREIERIDGLVGEILTLARLTSRSDESVVQTVDLMDLVNGIVDDAAFEGQARGMSVSNEGAATFVADVDGELIYRAFENVIRNALKYSPDRSHVSVRSEIVGETLRVTVADEGPGVQAPDLERIFQPFLRGSDAGAPEGYGLGLAITKRAIEKHGGRVTAALGARGGLRVTLEIPRRAPPDAGWHASERS
ncbi:HAMP domain-containing sensor histidine kinase [Ancylobacter amanitiformis]|uniref:Signal transduction histidine-protein kinase/phosphatase MprB n=1 Tax=Ancylobacter amanitiformis TaxID=217069 RepID=A0ABU0LTQ7_9HYPH|nr:HAMP domain-containing sensor histidine kinase [Ancylobacter amanitiformis]MDQ0512089.1 signal transduction histidine kinase [Ancylobacter amanitiformis]